MKKKSSTAKNDQQVIINGQPFNKRQAVLQAVRMLAKDYGNDLQIVNGLLKGTHGVYDTVLPFDEVKKKDYMVNHKRYFISPSDLIVDKNYKLWAVCNQWGIGNIGNVIDRLKKLKYKVKLR